MSQEGVLSNKGNKVKLLLIVILLLGTFLRVYGLGTESFWLDEADTAQAVDFSTSKIIERTYVNLTLMPEFFGKGGGSLPLYNILVKYWTIIFGLSEFKLRLFSVLFGVVSIYLIFLIGKFLFNSKIGLIAAFILAINHQQISFSQEARLYSMLVALTLFSAFSLLHALSSNKKAYWAGFVISSVAMLYTHYFSFFILFFEGIYTLALWKNNKKLVKEILFSSAIIFILYLPWISAFFRQVFFGPPIGRIIGSPSIFKLISTLIGFNSWISPDLNSRIALRAMNFSQLPVLGWILIISVIMITILLAGAFILGLIKSKEGKFSFIYKKNHGIFFLLIWLLIPVLIPFVISLISPENAIFSDIRYVLAATPAYYLICACGIFKMRRWKGIFLALLVIFSISPLYSYYVNFDTQQWREASEYLHLNRPLDQALFIQKANGILPLRYYYTIDDNIITIDTADDFIPALEGKQSFWLVLALEKYSDPKGLVKAYADSNYNLVQKKEYNGIKILHYREMR